ncbi:hypothetical protein [Rhodanobacter sp. OK091]|uniref:hypothetical protein n=1 Tax=Rhodanobacter sp. OK091 TaxID=1881037 RepID=UPI0009330B39|nr:hypothetical protein [Rhodanobacter sp. OK091]
MDEHALTFRTSRIHLLKFFASAEEQRRFQTEVCKSEGYAYDEFACWWADDFHPDSKLFRSAFSPTEIVILSNFNNAFESALTQIGEHVPNVEQLLSLTAWQSVIAAAASAHVALDP